MNITADGLAVFSAVVANFMLLVHIAVKFERRFTTLEVNMSHVQAGLHSAGVLRTRDADALARNPHFPLAPTE